MDKIAVALLSTAYYVAFIAPILKNFTNLNGIMWKAHVPNFTQIGINYGEYVQKLFYAVLNVRH
jgi:type IV secretory pathway TrbL component